MENKSVGVLRESIGTGAFFLDYGGPNAAKALHVGHLRSAIIGESLKRLAQATGRTTVGDVHLGDWGLQMGLVMAEIEERGESKVSKENWDTIYPYASQKSKEDPAFMEKAPNYICENAYKIAQAFSKFYSESHIVGETDTVKKAAWVKLCIATKKILEKHLEILGIEPVEEM